MGFVKVAKHRSKDVSLYRQGDVNFIVNAEQDSFAQGFARVHGPSVCAIALPGQNSAAAYKRALSLGAWGVEGKVGPMELNIPAIKGIGDSLIYLVDRYGDRGTIYDVDFEYPAGRRAQSAGRRPHLHRPPDRTTCIAAAWREWADFYERLFNFREIRYFDIEGKLTGLKIKAMTSPCGKIRIPINESTDDKSQIQEYLVGLSRRGHPAHRARHRRHLPDRRDAADQGRAVPDRARHLLRAGRRAAAGPRRGPRSAWPPTAS